MAKSNTNAFIAKKLDDIFYHLKNVDKIQVLAGCTRPPLMAEKVINICSVPELALIEKRERYIEFGPAVTLEQMMQVGRNNLPQLLYEALESVGNSAVRNQATLGGNICASLAESQKMTLWAPLIALGTAVEVKKSATDSKVVPLNKVEKLPPKSMLGKIRIPLNDWEIAIFRRVGPSHAITSQSASFVFLADLQKDIIANLRIVFSGPVTFQSAELENKIIGTKLPLKAPSIDSIMQDAASLYDSTCSSEITPPILRAQFLNLLRYSLDMLV